MADENRPTPLPELRAFTGICGSPLSIVTEPQVISEQAEKRRRGRGRPRKFASAADKQKAHRRRKEIAAVLESPETPIDAVTGGYDTAQIDRVFAAHEQKENNGRRVTPSGAGPNDETAPPETDDCWIRKQERRGAFKRGSKGLSDRDFEKSITGAFCSKHSLVEAGTAGSYQDGNQTVLLYRAVRAVCGTKDLFTLQCGCSRIIQNNGNIVTRKKRR